MSGFDEIWSQSVQPIDSPSEESALIDKAACGDGDAVLRLIAAYLPLLNDVISQHRRGLDLDDARQTAVEALMIACRTRDVSRNPRLAGHLRATVAREVSAASVTHSTTVSIPERTLQRYYSILAHAEGDPARGAKIAQQYLMSADTFREITRAVRCQSDSALVDRPEDTSVRVIRDVSERVMAQKALSAVNDLERDVCRLYYGFVDYDPVPDAEVAHRLGISRPRTQRVRQTALDKMRVVVGAVA
jgi:RNA polymerase sigma factor (sigma-70 family)